MKLNIERKATFESSSDWYIKVTLNKIITSICKRYTMKQDMLNSSTWQAMQAPREVSTRSRPKCPCVRYVCPILNLWVMISSRRGERSELITFTFGSIACSLFWVSVIQRACYYFNAWVIWVSCIIEMNRPIPVKLDTGAAFATISQPSYLPVQYLWEPYAHHVAYGQHLQSTCYIHKRSCSHTFGETSFRDVQDQLRSPLLQDPLRCSAADKIWDSLTVTKRRKCQRHVVKIGWNWKCDIRHRDAVVRLWAITSLRWWRATHSCCVELKFA